MGLINVSIGDHRGGYLEVFRVMGNADKSISDHCRERFPDDRLQKVVDHVHSWLYGSTVEQCHVDRDSFRMEM